MSTSCQRIQTCLAIALMLTGNICRAQSGDGLRYKVKYQCKGEAVVVEYCRHDSDRPGFPPTIPQNDYCSVYYPDRPPRNGIILPSVILRSEIVRQLQECSALPRPLAWAPKQGNTVAEQMELASRSFAAKDYPAALAQYQKVLTLSPDPATQAMADLKIGWIYDNASKFDKAIPFLRESTRLSPGNGGAFYELGYASYSLKQYGEALASLQKAVQLLPNDISARHWLGSTEAALGRIDDALASYRVLQRLSVDEANDLFLEITQADLDAKAKQSSVDKRAEAYRTLDSSALLAKANQGDDAAMKRLSDLYFEKKDSANGLHWKIKAAERGDPELQNNLGWYYENNKDVSEARKWYAWAGEQGGESAELNLCTSYASQFGLDQGVISGADKDNRQSPITPLRGSKADIDEAFRWCERAGDRGMYRAAWFAGVLNAKGSADRAPNYEDAYFWLANGGLPAGAVFREKVGMRLTPAKRAEMEKLASGFHPSPMTLLHERMQKATQQPK